MAGHDSLRDDEYLLHRIKLEWFNSQTNKASPAAFTPRERDTDGLSFYRASQTSLPAAARDRFHPERLHFVAKVRVGQIRALGMNPEITGGNGPHVAIRNLSARERNLEKTSEWASKLASDLAEVLCPVSKKPPAHGFCHSCKDKRCQLSHSFRS